MNKTTLIVLLIVFLGLGVAGFSYLTSNKKTEITPNSMDQIVTPTDTEVPSKIGSMKTTLADLIKLGKDYECTYDYTNESASKLTGTVFVANSGSKMNGTFTMLTKDGTEVKSNVIRDGEYMYIWTDAFPQGVKTKISADDDALFGTKGQQPSDKNSPTTPPTDMAMDFTCKDWNVDSSIFNPPENIKFVDMTAQLQQMMDNAQYTEESKCGMCNSLSGNAQTQCKAALGCN